METDSFVCSREEYLFSDFVKKYSLPQLVKVEQGHDGENEETSLSGGQIMTLHSMREVDTVVAKDIRKRTVYIPRNCNQKVELVMKEAWNCHTVAELSQFSPKAVRVLSMPETDKTVSINVGDKLTVKRKKKKYLECENQSCERVRLPMNLQARFVALYDGNEYLIHQVVKKFLMPVMVQFIDAIEEKNTKAKSIFNSSLGILTLEKVLKEESVVCSTGELNSSKRYVVTIPRNFNITVAAMKSTTTEGSFLKDLNEGIELAKVDTLEAENIYASRQEVRGYMQLSLFRAQSTRPNLPGPAKNLLERYATSSGYASLATTRGKTPGVKASIDEKTFNSTSNSNNDTTLDKRSESSKPVYPKLEPIAGKNSISSGYASLATSRGKTPGVKASNDAETFSSTSNSNYDTTLDKRSDSSNPIYAKPVLKAEKNEKIGEQRNKKESEREIAFKPPSTLGIQKQVVDLTSFSVDNVAELLAKHKLGAFVNTFKEENIDGRMLLELDNDSLTDLGLSNFQAKKLLMVINGWKPKIEETEA